MSVLTKGRKPSYSRKQFKNAQALGLTRQTVYRVKADPAAAEAALATWGI